MQAIVRARFFSGQSDCQELEWSHLSAAVQLPGSALALLMRAVSTCKTNESLSFLSPDLVLQGVRGVSE